MKLVAQRYRAALMASLALVSALAFGVSPAAANVGQDTCLVDGTEVEILTDTQPIRRYTVFGQRDDGSLKWLGTSTARTLELTLAQVTEFEGRMIGRYVIADGADSAVDVPCVADPNIEPEPDPNFPDPDYTPGCRLADGNLSWKTDVGDGLVNQAWNVREVLADGSTKWRATVRRGFWFAEGDRTGDYIVRYRYQGPSGVQRTFEFPCEGPGDELNFECVQNGSVLSWSDVRVVGKFNVRELREDGSSRWYASTTDTSITVDADEEYVLRIRVQDGNQDVLVVDNACT